MNAATMLDLKRRFFPWKAEMYLFLAALLLGGIYAVAYVFRLSANIGILAAAATIGATVAFLGGTRACIPLYFTTMFGAQLVLPGVPASLNKAFAALMMLSFAFDVFRERLRWKLSFTLFAYFILQAYIIVACIILRPPKGDFPIQVAFYLVPMIAIWALFWRDNWMRWLLKGFVLASFVGVAVPGLAELLFNVNITVQGIGPGTGRIDGISSNAIIFGLNAIWIIPFAVALLLSERNRAWQAFCLLNIGVLVLLAIATGNRQTPILLAAQLCVFLVLMRHRLKPWLVGFALVSALIVAPLFIVKLWDRFSTAADPMNDYSLAFRRDKIVVAGEIIKTHPWFGIGHDHYKYTWYFYKPRGRLIYMSDDYREQYIDMGYVQILTEYGIVGVAGFLILSGSLFLFFARHYWLSRREANIWHTNLMAAIGSGFALFYLANFISDAFMSPRMFLLFGMLFAAASAVDLEREKVEHADGA